MTATRKQGIAAALVLHFSAYVTTGTTADVPAAVSTSDIASAAAATTEPGTTKPETAATMAAVCT